MLMRSILDVATNSKEKVISFYLAFDTHVHLVLIVMLYTYDV